jgi:4'-phosphopantetheinyl transferase
VLSPEELARAARFHREVHRSAFLTTHTALREVLGAALGRDPARLSFAAGPHGKPELVLPAGDPALHFNLSDTEGLGLLAVSCEGPLGVDVERHREDRSLLDVAERFFSPAELCALRAVDAEGRLQAFHRIWTRKEAFLKALGLGLARELDSFDVSHEPGAAARLVATRPDPAEAARWRLLDLDVGPDHSAALAVPVPPSPASPSPAAPGACPELHWFDWPPAEELR